MEPSRTGAAPACRVVARPHPHPRARRRHKVDLYARVQYAARV